MIDFNSNSNCSIYSELSEDQQKFWFDFKQRKFLHNYDNLYYTVKLVNDFTSVSEDPVVIHFRKYFDTEKSRLLSNPNNFVTHYVPDCGNLNLLNRTFKGMYKYWLECPDDFDIIIAPIVPPSSSSISITPEIFVQIRSYCIWSYGVNSAFERSYKYVESLCNEFNLKISSVLENRADYCWHTNYFLNPEKFFTMDNLYKFRISRYENRLP